MSLNRKPRKYNALPSIDWIEYAFSFIYANREFFAAPFLGRTAAIQMQDNLEDPYHPGNAFRAWCKLQTGSNKQLIHDINFHLRHALTSEKTEHETLGLDLEWKKLLIGTFGNAGDPSCDNLLLTRDKSGAFHKFLHANPKVVEAIISIASNRPKEKHDPQTATTSAYYDKLLMLSNPIIDKWYLNNQSAAVYGQRIRRIHKERRQFSDAIHILQIAERRRDEEKYEHMAQSLYINIEYFAQLSPIAFPLPAPLEKLQKQLHLLKNAPDSKALPPIQEISNIFAAIYHEISNDVAGEMEFKSFIKLSNITKKNLTLFNLLYQCTQQTHDIEQWYAKSPFTENREKRIELLNNKILTELSDDEETSSDAKFNDVKEVAPNVATAIISAAAIPITNLTTSSIAIDDTQAAQPPADDDKDFKFEPLKKLPRCKLSQHNPGRATITKTQYTSTLFWNDPKWQMQYPFHPETIAAIAKTKKNDTKETPASSTDIHSANNTRVLSSHELIAQINTQLTTLSNSKEADEPAEYAPDDTANDGETFYTVSLK